MNPVVDIFAGWPRWVNWKYEMRNGKRTKVPYQPNGKKADSTNPETWSMLPAVYAARGFDGFGFVFDDDVLGVDLDGVLDEAGNITDEASAKFVAAANSYTEVTPSKRGLHVFLGISDTLTLERNRSGNYECYIKGRFFTVTGVSFGQAKNLRVVSAALALELLKLLGYPWQPQPAQIASTPAAFHDDNLIEKIKKSHQGGKFSRLMDGVITGYPSDSEADAALCAVVAWWTKDEAQIERVWGKSALANREKFKRDDYRKRTIQHALAKVAGEYQPQQRTPASIRQPQHVSQDAFARILDRVGVNRG